MEQRDRIRSILQSQILYEQTMEELHKLQDPGVYSELAESFGWSEEQVPAFLGQKVMEEIRYSEEEVSLNHRVMLSIGFLFLLLSAALLFSIVEFLRSMNLAAQEEALFEVFWLVVSLVGSGSVMAIFLLRYHERENKKGCSLHPIEKMIRSFLFWK